MLDQSAASSSPAAQLVLDTAGLVRIARKDPPPRNRPCPCGSGKKYKMCCEKTAPLAASDGQRQPTIAEINLERAFVGFGADMSDLLANSDPGERVVHAGEVLCAMEDAYLAGTRTLLVSVDSFGGQLEGGVLLYDAFRAFRAAGGRVVVFLSGAAGSTLSWAILAADMVVARKGARILVHGPSQGLLPEATAWKRAIYRTGTLAPPETIEAWISEPSHPDGRGVVALDAHRARELGFVDFVGGKERARELALALGRGEQVASPRRTALQARGELPEFAEALAGLRAGADVLQRSVVRKTAQDAVYARRQIDPALIVVPADTLSFGDSVPPAIPFSTFMSVGFNLGQQTTNANAAYFAPRAGSVSNFAVRVKIASAGAGTVFTVMLNGAATALTLTVPAGSTGLFTFAGVVQVAAGDLISVQAASQAGMTATPLSIYATLTMALA